MIARFPGCENVVEAQGPSSEVRPQLGSQSDFERISRVAQDHRAEGSCFGAKCDEVAVQSR